MSIATKLDMVDSSARPLVQRYTTYAEMSIQTLNRSWAVDILVKASSRSPVVRSTRIGDNLLAKYVGICADVASSSVAGTLRAL